MNIPAVGATSLGVVIGWLVRYFIRRFTKFTPMVFGSLVSIVLGGATIKFLDADKTVWWFYPIGLLIGFVLYHFGSIISDFFSSPPGSGGNVPKPLYSDKSNPYRIK